MKWKPSEKKMTKRLSEDVNERIAHAASLYYRLILVVGLPDSGKTNALREVAEHTGAPLININLELSRHMLELNERQRILQVQRFLDQTVAELKQDVVLLDNTEILFDSVLKQNPLRLLQSLSRSKTIVATWNGFMESDHIYYATLGHPDHRCYPVDGILVVNAEVAG